MSCRLPLVSVTASGVPWRSTIRWCLEPGRVRSRGRRAPPFEGSDVRSVHGAVVQVQQARAAKFGQQRGMQAGPDARLGPVPQPAPGVTPEQPTTALGTSRQPRLCARCR